MGMQVSGSTYQKFQTCDQIVLLNLNEFQKMMGWAQTFLVSDRVLMYPDRILMYPDRMFQTFRNARMGYTRLSQQVAWYLKIGRNYFNSKFSIHALERLEKVRWNHGFRR